jgi:hypothetical protein
MLYGFEWKLKIIYKDMLIREEADMACLKIVPEFSQKHRKWSWKYIITVARPEC